MEKEVLDGDELRGLIAAHTPTPTDIPRPPNPLSPNGHHSNGADHVRTVTVERENGDGQV
jgi:hypothetical protein